MLKRTRQGGFSLIELLISFVVLLVGVLSVMSLFPLGMRESKAMMESSSAAFVARAARGYMEAHPFIYNPGNKNANGTASIIQVMFGPRAGVGGYRHDRFPIMFPEDVLGVDDCDYDPFSKDQRPEWGSSSNPSRPRIVDLDHPEYSWDARFVLGGGPRCSPYGEKWDEDGKWVMFPPKSLPPTAAHQYTPGDPENYFNYNDVWRWRIQYFNYYAVQISVYRNYEEVKPALSDVTIVTKVDLKPDGTEYEGTDPNRPIHSELVLSTPPPMQLTVGSHIRIADARSDWYEIKRFRFEEGKWVYRLDRRVTSKLPMLDLELDSTEDTKSSVGRSDVIVTNSLIESFTTILPSQIDDMDTRGLSIP